MIIPVSLLYFTTFVSNLAQILFAPRSHPLWFFLLVSNKICLGDSCNFNNFDWNPVVLKKIAKTPKNYNFSANLCENGIPIWATIKTEKQIFFAKIPNKTSQIIRRDYSIQGNLRLSMKVLQFLWNFHHLLLSMR